MAAEVLFEVEAVGQDLGMVRGCHFSNRKTREKANYTRIIFWTLRKNNEWRRVLFQIFWFFPMKIKIIVKKFVQVLRKLSKCEEICPSVWKKNFPHTWTNFFTLGQIFKHLFCPSIMIHGILVIKLVFRKRFGQIFCPWKKPEKFGKILWIYSFHFGKVSQILTFYMVKMKNFPFL